MLKLNILKPSANNMTVRVFVRAAGLDFVETDAWGHTRSPEFLAICPAHLTPMIEAEDLPRGAMWESCAIMQYLSNTHGLEDFYPSAPARRATIDNAMFYATGTLYPLVARATYPALGFPLYPGEVGASDAADAAKEQARQDASTAVAEPLAVFGEYFLGKDRFIGGAKPSIADIRLAATLEFLAAIDYPAPERIKRFLTDVESALGSAYSEPAADVRGYIQYVKSNRG